MKASKRALKRLQARQAAYPSSSNSSDATKHYGLEGFRMPGSMKVWKKHMKQLDVEQTLRVAIHFMVQAIDCQSTMILEMEQKEPDQKKISFYEGKFRAYRGSADYLIGQLLYATKENTNG